MSLITRCPACSTLFKVVADQLKISKGWVRCGQCAEVFDAQAHMAIGASEQSEPSIPAPLQAEITALVEKAEDASPPLTQPAAATPNADFTDSNWYNTVNPPAPHSYADSVGSGRPSALNPNLGTDELVAVGRDSLPSEPSLMDRASLLPAGTQPATPDAELPSFVRQAQRAQRWRSPWVRTLLLLVGVVLFAALSAQIAVHERDRIASQEPRALPWLAQLCAALGCTVEPLKQIESVVVDASSFNKLRSDGKFELYKFTFNLKNTSALAVAVPHIELSLNDAQDQPILRRVLKPADVGASQSVLPPAAELTGGSAIQVDSSQLAGARIAGYRVWVFYP